MLKAISLFTGVGGLDFGFEAAGFETVVAVEIDPVSSHTLRLNRNWPVIERDIHEVTSKELLRTARLRPGQADVLIGGPPCQPFSKSGYWARGDSLRLDDPRADTLMAYLRVLRDAGVQSIRGQPVEEMVVVMTLPSDYRRLNANNPVHAFLMGKSDTCPPWTEAYGDTE